MASRLLDQRELLRLAGMYHLLGDPNRLTVMLSCFERATAVSDIAARSGLSVSLVSHHLRLLRMGGLVTAERRGRQVFYTVADGHVSHMLSDMLAHVTHCEGGASRGHGGQEEKITKKARRATPIASLRSSAGARGGPARLHDADLERS